jgi:hypothetical protein
MAEQDSRWDHKTERGWSTNQWLSRNKNRRRRSAASLAAKRASARAFKEDCIARKSAEEAARLTAAHYIEVLDKLKPQIMHATQDAEHARSVLASVEEEMSAQLVEAAAGTMKLRDQLRVQEEQAARELDAARTLMDRMVTHFEEVQQAAKSEAAILIVDARDRAIAELAEATGQLVAARQQAIVLQTELWEMLEQLIASRANWEDQQRRQEALMALYHHTCPDVLGPTLVLRVLQKTHAHEAAMLHCKLVAPLTGPELRRQGWGAIAPPYVGVQQYSDNIAFAVFLPPAELRARREEALKFFKLLADSTQPLPRKDPIGFVGKCNGFGWRAAMTLGQPCGHYALMPGQARRELWEAN